MQNNFTVLSPIDFLKDVKEEAKSATKRLWGQAMEIEPGEITNTFLTIFTDCAKRGIDTRLHGDHYALMVTDGLFNYIPLFNKEKEAERRRRLEAKIRAYKELEEKGVKMLLTNPPNFFDRLFPMKGRNHMKMVIVDDIAWIGGVNFHDHNFIDVDIMVRIRIPEIVEELVKLYLQIDNREVIKDTAIQCDPESTLLYDGGEINKSIILTSAAKMAEEAKKSVIFISPIIPDGPILDSFFNIQKKGISIKIVMPNIKTMSGIYTMLDEVNYNILKLRGFKVPIYFHDTMIHAKVLITDEEKVIFGSHNLTRRGVQMGTEELALQSTNPLLVSSLLQYFQSLRDRAV